jgi:AraC-like DNA-binding protein
MSLRYYRPQSARLNFVESFGILDEPQAAFNQRCLLPDSRPVVLINLGAPLLWEGTSLPRVVFLPAQARLLRLWASGATHTLGLHLAGWAMRLLVDEPVDPRAAPIVPLGGDWSRLAAALAGTLQRQGDLAALYQLEQFVSDRQRRATPALAPMRRALGRLWDTRGGCRLPELATHCHLSPSQLERQSRYFTGHTPKTLARLIRFDAACAGLMAAPPQGLTQLAHGLGFADQAHFVHEFQALAGCTPRAAQAHIRRLAAGAEFLQLS